MCWGTIFCRHGPFWDQLVQAMSASVRVQFQRAPEQASCSPSLCQLIGRVQNSRELPNEGENGNCSPTAREGSGEKNNGRKGRELRDGRLTSSHDKSRVNDFCRRQALAHRDSLPSGRLFRSPIRRYPGQVYFGRRVRRGVGGTKFSFRA